MTYDIKPLKEKEMKVSYAPYLPIHQDYLSCLDFLSFWVEYIPQMTYSVLYERWDVFTKDYKRFLRLYHFLTTLMERYKPLDDLLKLQAVNEFLESTFPNMRELNSLVLLLYQFYDYLVFCASDTYFDPYQIGKPFFSGNQLILNGYSEEILGILNPYIEYLTKLINNNKLRNYYAPITANRDYAEKQYRKLIDENLKIFKEKQGQLYKRHILIKQKFIPVSILDNRPKKRRKRNIYAL